MKILSIETSCDETAVSVLAALGGEVRVCGNALSSQIELHAQYGGVFPMMAKRAHAEKIIPLLEDALSQAGLLVKENCSLPQRLNDDLETTFAHEPGLAARVIQFAQSYARPAIDAIAVTSGPGLAPALWVGVNTALALNKIWNVPVFPINHMEGHLMSALFRDTTPGVFKIHELEYPALSLLVSGGHTELILMENPQARKKIGATRDDAVGEAFDKVARILGLPYPGGPKISALAKEARERNVKSHISLPRPMRHSSDYDFSYSGLKTAVLYATKDTPLTEEQKQGIAREFEEAAIEPLVAKTKKACEDFSARTLLVGGGVAANQYLRAQLSSLVESLTKMGRSTTLLFPPENLTSDNSVMIGMALAYQFLHGQQKTADTIRADGNLSF